MSVTASVLTFGRMVKFSHTIFALPFALAASALATRGQAFEPARWAAIVVAMAAARTAAMGFNRIVDRSIDAHNPRTANRELPSGKVTLPAAITLTMGSTGLFIATAAFLGRLPLLLSPVALLLLFGYSYTKRFTWLCHLILGLAIAAGPAGAWIALRGDFTLVPALLMLAVAAWIGGFDVLYALADRDFDAAAKLRSIPVRFGVPGALRISTFLHALTIGALSALGPVAGLGPVYLAGTVIIAGFLWWEHAILTPSDLRRLDMAFFALNGYVSVGFLVAVVADLLLGS